jgi:type VII secretion protein EccE
MPRVWAKQQLPAGARTAGGFGATQLVAVELVVVAVSTAVLTGTAVTAGVTGVVAAVLLVGALGRFGDRWGYEAVAARHRWWRRRRAVARTSARPPAGPPAPLRPLAGELRITSVTDRGTAIGVGQDELGWFAVLAVAPPAGGDGAVLRLEWLARLVAEATLPVSTVQLVTRYLAAPSAGLDERTACVRSYRELLGDAALPAHREIWLAARLGPADAAHAAAARGGDLAGVHKALASALARLGTGLDATGLRHRVLDADELRETLTVACGLEQPLAGGLGGPVPAGAAPAVERWASWHAAGAVHVCFGVRGWPAQARPDLLAEVSRAPGAVTVHTAVLLRPLRDGPAEGGGDAPVAVRALVRVVAAPERIAGCVAQVLGNARRLGVRLNRLDGEQASGVYATAPTGATGAPQW